uniref:Immunoglobulin V-set domain-containing protein n=1 Tax=Anolis carolinensis TaxID=28377 RepID=A0A803SVA8_ANOCA
ATPTLAPPPVFCFVLAGAQTLLTNITVEPENPVDGGSVRLTPTSVPENTNTCRWYRGEESPQNIILEYFTHASPSFQWRDAYTGREDMDFKCSIEIKELKGIDSGTYMVTIVSADQTVKGKVDIVVSGTFQASFICPAFLSPALTWII